MNLKQLLIALGVGLLIGAAGMFYLNPPQTKTVQVEKQTAVTKKDIVTVVKEIVHQDGSKEIITTSTDKSTEKKDSTFSITATTKKKDWLIGATASVTPDHLVPSYGILAQRRILGPIFIGLGVNTSKTATLNVAIEF